MKLIIIGPPGCGKGTQAKRIAQQFKLKHISTGDLLRKEEEKNTDLSKSIKETIKNGRFVSDELITEIMQKHLNENYILDGFPRNIKQIDMLECNVDCVIYLNLDTDKCVQRILKRNEGRADDNEDILRERMEIYEKNTLPVIEYFEKKQILMKIDASGSVDDVFRNIVDVINKI